MEGLCRIEAEDGKAFFLVIISENGGKYGFEIQLCDGEHAWKSTVSQEEVFSMSKAVDMTIDEYVFQSIDVLAGKTVGPNTLAYEVKQEGDAQARFLWKKNLGDGVKFQLGSVTLNKVPDCRKLVMEMFSLAVGHISQHKREIFSLKSENCRLSDERTNAIKLLDKCVTAKDDMEKDLFQKFAAVLNAKKAKIRQLQSNVSDYTKDKTNIEQPEQSSKTKYGISESNIGVSARTESLVSDNDSTGSKTPSPPLSDVSHDNKAEESTSIASTMSPSLFLQDDSEPIEVETKRRRRVPRKETQRNKLVLPKVTPVKKTISSSSEDSIATPHSLRKRFSDRPLPDPDDLMAEM